MYEYNNCDRIKNVAVCKMKCNHVFFFSDDNKDDVDMRKKLTVEIGNKR